MQQKKHRKTFSDYKICTTDFLKSDPSQSHVATVFEKRKKKQVSLKHIFKQHIKEVIMQNSLAGI